MRTIRALSLAALVSLAGCSFAAERGRQQTTAPSPARQDAQAAAQQHDQQGAAQPSSAPSRPAVSPEAFVGELYKEHGARRSPFFQTKDRALVDRYFEKSLADLIWKDAVESEGEVGSLGADPLYNAQDTELKNFAVHALRQEGDTAEVAVTFENFAEKQRIVYRLIGAGAAWKIADIDYGDNTTLSKMLKQ